MDAMLERALAVYSAAFHLMPLPFLSHPAPSRNAEKADQSSGLQRGQDQWVQAKGRASARARAKGHSRELAWLLVALLDVLAAMQRAATYVATGTSKDATKLQLEGHARMVAATA